MELRRMSNRRHYQAHLQLDPGRELVVRRGHFYSSRPTWYNFNLREVQKLMSRASSIQLPAYSCGGIFVRSLPVGKNQRIVGPTTACEEDPYTRQPTSLLRKEKGSGQRQPVGQEWHVAKLESF